MTASHRARERASAGRYAPQSLIVIIPQITMTERVRTVGTWA